jgi:hypothetical protein
MKSTTFSSVPRDARHAASRGFNFREGFLEVEDDFVDANKMARRGTMEISDDQGNTVEVPFTAVFTFDKPVPVRKSVAA